MVGVLPNGLLHNSSLLRCLPELPMPAAVSLSSFCSALVYHVCLYVLLLLLAYLPCSPPAAAAAAASSFAAASAAAAVPIAVFAG